MDPVGKQRLPVAAAAAATSMPFFIFIAGADAGAQERFVHIAII
jgi:hypothetical protein